uniref:Ascarylose C n=1 Tax=Monochamus alternatus TaxID=192382 RepID=A0A120MH82_MONAT|nr:ascarylose C [Monochamus alternatus]
MSDKLAVLPRLQGIEKSIWKEYGELAEKYKPLNLGLGFPDFSPPKFVTDALKEVLNTEDPLLHQYSRPTGHLHLVKVLANLYTRLLQRDVNAETEILVTLGASEGLLCAVTGLVGEGDEVIIIEPYFDVYVPLIKIAGGVPKFVALKPKSKTDGISSSADWVFDPKELESLFNSKTKAIILNTPNNPLGKVFDLSELTLIADLCKKWNVLCISDEVYEFMVYKPNEHIRIASLPGMWERTVTIGSAGKTFCATGWKVGWVYGSANLLRSLQIVHHYSVYGGSTPMEKAIAIAVEKELSRFGEPDSYFVTLQNELKTKRDYIVKKLSEANMNPVIPDGGFLIIADWSQLESRIDLSSEKGDNKDERFTKWLIKNIGLGGIPPTVFYNEKNKGVVENFVRFCFIKKQENLDKAAELLMKLN